LSGASSNPYRWFVCKTIDTDYWIARFKPGDDEVERLQFRSANEGRAMQRCWRDMLFARLGIDQAGSLLQV
jgi:hypothetical protein